MKTGVNITKRNIVLCALLFWAALLVISCDDTEVENDYPHSGLFRPQFTEITTGGNWVYANWDKYNPAEKFLLELSIDTFHTVYRDTTTEEHSHTFRDVEYDTQYWIRIKSFGNDLESEVYEYPEPISTNDVATNLNSIQSVSDKGVRVSWYDVDYDSLVIAVKEEEYTKRVKVVNELDNESKVADIFGLEPNTAYMVMAYGDGEYQGKQRFTTKEVMDVKNDNVIDLRDSDVYPGLEDVDKLNQALKDYSNAAVATTIVLKGGTEYYYTESVTLTAALSIIADYSLDGNAIVRRSQRFNCVNPGFVGGNMRFERVSFLAHPDLPVTGKGEYLFAAPGFDVDTLSFNDCVIRHARANFNTAEGFHVKVLSYNNSIVDSITSMPLIRNRDGSDPNRGKIDELSITNCTFINVFKGLVSGDAELGLKKVNIQYVTFFQFDGDEWQFSFSKESQIVDFTIENCIFAGASNSEESVTSMRGLRIGDGSVSPTYSNNYITNDITWGSGAIDCTSLDFDYKELFVDPENDDFTLRKKSYATGAGDSRWWR